MKKNDVFTFTAPNGVEVTAIVIDIIKDENGIYIPGVKFVTHLCYAQNRLFLYEEKTIYNKTSYKMGKILVDYAILPDYDALLERYNDIEVAQAETASGM